MTPSRTTHAALASLATLLGATIAPSAAQTTLAGALRQADRAAFANRIASSQTAVQSAQATAALKGILPTVRFEAGYVRTTDPINAFGTRLRERAITAADFDPARLNYPAPITDYQGGIVLEQPIFNADAWAGRHAALEGAAAGRASEEWTRLSTRVEVIRAYYGAVLAAERARTLRAAALAAHAHEREAAAMARHGVVTASDALLASVRAGAVDADLAEATGNLATARAQLAVTIGDATPGGASVPDALPSADRIRAAVAQDTANVTPDAVRRRADVRAATRSLDAAQTDALRARTTYLPRINAVGRYDWNSPERPYAGERSWTVGLMATWTPFAGGSQLADVAASRARATSARAQAEGAAANARLQLSATRTALVVALERLAIAEQGAAQSATAHRIVARKYGGGLATIAELLDAQATETQSALALSQARYATIVAAADRLRAIGDDPAALTALDAPEPVAGDRAGAAPSTSRPR